MKLGRGGVILALLICTGISACDKSDAERDKDVTAAIESGHKVADYQERDLKRSRANEKQMANIALMGKAVEDWSLRSDQMEELKKHLDDADFISQLRRARLETLLLQGGNYGGPALNQREADWLAGRTDSADFDKLLADKRKEFIADNKR